MKRFADLLANVISETQSRIEKKQAQTYEEMQVCYRRQEPACSC